MSYTYAQKRKGTGNAPASPGKAGAAEKNIPNSMRLAMLESGQADPTAADKGHRVDLPEAMRARMENSFGMDFSKVRLYESRTLGETGAEAMAQGNEIAFAPGKLDFASAEGAALLGHELSHVASQARGEVQGNGFLQDSALEARADREGAMAARGESLYGGATAPLSSASPAAMSGPMQAKKKKKNKKGSSVPEAAGPSEVQAPPQMETAPQVEAPAETEPEPVKDTRWQRDIIPKETSTAFTHLHSIKTKSNIMSSEDKHRNVRRGALRNAFEASEHPETRSMRHKRNVQNILQKHGRINLGKKSTRLKSIKEVAEDDE